MSSALKLCVGVRRRSWFVFASCFALVALADVLFYGHVPGWTAGLFTLSFLLALLLRPTFRAHFRAKFLIALAVVGLSLGMVEEPTPLSLLMAFIAIVLLAMTSRIGWTTSAAVWARRWTRLILLGWSRIFGDVIVSLRWSHRHPGSRRAGPALLLRTAGKWIVPLLLGGVFIALFAVANPLIDRWVSQLGNKALLWIEAFPNLLDPARIFFWLCVMSGSWALLRLRGKGDNRSTHRTPEVSPRRMVLLPSRRGWVTRCLIVFNMVFAVETASDIVYLCLGRHLPAGMTFNEYAHRGSYPLIATALLSAIFVLITFGRECEGSNWRTARLLVYAWITQNVLLTFSAGWRLRLLINDSNLTRWRLSTLIWLGLVTLGLLAIITRIFTRRDNRWLLHVNIAMAASVLYACCFLNLDGFIANYNADHCLEVAHNGNVLGLTYLHSLGIESIPALDRLSRTLDTPERRAVAQDFADDLRDHVATELSDWRGWTWRRWRLRPSRPLLQRTKPLSYFSPTRIW